jgi:hypothetical protein
MTQKQINRLARAFAPREVVERLDKIETLKRELRNLQTDMRVETHAIMSKVATAEFTDNHAPTERITVLNDHPLPPVPVYATAETAFA